MTTHVSRRRVRKERRKDEESLYYIIERDLDREAIFPHHDGWRDQAKTRSHGTIDYVVRYGEKLLGIEVKKGTPDFPHFRQASRYNEVLDAVFLAYTSDRVGEALYLSQTKQQHFEIGLISIATFRSHIIRPATAIDRGSDEIWEKYFDEEQYWTSFEDLGESLDKNKCLIATALREDNLWLSVDKSGKITKDVFPYPIEPSTWRTLAALYALSRATSIDRFHSWDDLRSFFQKMGWVYPNADTLIKAGFVYEWSYGSLLALYNFTDEVDVFRKEIIKVLRAKLGKTLWKRLVALSREKRKEHIDGQRKYEEDFLRTL